MVKVLKKKFKIPKTNLTRGVQECSPLKADGQQKEKQVQINWAQLRAKVQAQFDADKERKRTQERRMEEEKKISEQKKKEEYRKFQQRQKEREEAARKRREEGAKLREAAEAREAREHFLEIDQPQLIEEIDAILEERKEEPKLNQETSAQPTTTTQVTKRPRKVRCWNCGGRNHTNKQCSNASKQQLKKFSKLLNADLHVKTPKKNTMKQMSKTMTNLLDLVPAPPDSADLDFDMAPVDSTDSDTLIKLIPAPPTRPTRVEMCDL